MKKVAILCIFGMLVLMGCAGCSDPPTPPVEEPEFFPLTYQFLNKSDTTIKGGFDIHLAAYYPKKDSSHYRFTGLNNPAVGYHFEETFDEDNIGYPGVEMVLIFAAMKVWPDHWPDREPLYQTLKWFYIEKRTVKDSLEAIMSFTWPEDTARADVHEFDPDASDGDFGFDPEAAKKFKRLFQNNQINGNRIQ